MNEDKKCSSEGHEKTDAKSYCNICMIYMCNKCEIVHSKLCKKHKICNINRNDKDEFTGICSEKNHSYKLEFFCKSHNQLCCALCITKIKNKEYGKHNECEICAIEDIKENKKNELGININTLEKLSSSLKNLTVELNQIQLKLEENKENLKTKIINVFTKIRDCLNKREDELLLKVDEQFNKVFFKEDLIKQGKKYPNKIKKHIEEGRNIMKNWDESKLCFLINSCLNIENNIKELNEMVDASKNLSSNNFKISFTPDEKDFNNFLNEIKTFGNVTMPVPLPPPRQYIPPPPPPPPRPIYIPPPPLPPANNRPQQFFLHNLFG